MRRRETLTGNWRFLGKILLIRGTWSTKRLRWAGIYRLGLLSFLSWSDAFAIGTQLKCLTHRTEYRIERVAKYLKHLRLLAVTVLYSAWPRGYAWREERRRAERDVVKDRHTGSSRRFEPAFVQIWSIWGQGLRYERAIQHTTHTQDFHPLGQNWRPDVSPSFHKRFAPGAIIFKIPSVCQSILLPGRFLPCPNDDGSHGVGRKSPAKLGRTIPPAVPAATQRWHGLSCPIQRKAYCWPPTAGQQTVLEHLIHVQNDVHWGWHDILTEALCRQSHQNMSIKCLHTHTELPPCLDKEQFRD